MSTVKKSTSTHYTDGYEGKYNYKTYCDKEVHSHDEKNPTTVDPTEVTCEACKNNPKWEQDLSDTLMLIPNIKRRIFIQSDIVHASEVRSIQRTVADLCKQNKSKFVRRVFSDILGGAWHDLNDTWEFVKRADEIYADTSLLPLCGGSYMGSPVIFNGMCERAIKENISGKKVCILRRLKDINWYI
jgi:hypothetical protein